MCARSIRSAQLLNDWRTKTSESGLISVVGSVYNCPGAFDGHADHVTSAVVDSRGRMLVTREGAEYFLGVRNGISAEERASMCSDELSQEETAALGLQEDFLAV